MILLQVIAAGMIVATVLAILWALWSMLGEDEGDGH